MKYVPTEIVSAFTLIVTSLSSIDTEPLIKQIVAISFIGVGFGLTYLYIGFRFPPGKPKTAHYIISPFAFLAWAYPISAAMLGEWFIGIIAGCVQGVVILMSIFFPTEERDAGSSTSSGFS